MIIADAAATLHGACFGSSMPSPEEAEAAYAFLVERLRDWIPTKSDWRSAYDEAYRNLAAVAVHNYEQRFTR